MAGRPRTFKKVEDMQKAIDAYYKQQARKKRPLTIQGLALALGFNSRQSFLNYEGYTDDNDKEYLDTIKKARLVVENDKIEGMLSGEYSATGVIFDLKNNHGHKDSKQFDHDHTSKGDKIKGVAPIDWANDESSNKTK